MKLIEGYRNLTYKKTYKILGLLVCVLLIGVFGEVWVTTTVMETWFKYLLLGLPYYILAIKWIKE